MEITIKSFKSNLQGVKASLSIGIDGIIWITGVNVREGKNGDFLAYPSYKSGEEWKSYIMAKKEFTQAILDNYNTKKEVKFTLGEVTKGNKYNTKLEDNTEDIEEEDSSTFPF